MRRASELGYGGDQAAKKRVRRGCCAAFRHDRQNLRMHAVQEAKNKKHATDLICNNNIAGGLYTGHCISSFRVVQSVLTTANETCSRATPAEPRPGETSVLLVARVSAGRCLSKIHNQHGNMDMVAPTLSTPCMAPVNRLEQWLRGQIRCDAPEIISYIGYLDSKLCKSSIYAGAK